MKTWISQKLIRSLARSVCTTRYRRGDMHEVHVRLTVAPEPTSPRYCAHRSPQHLGTEHTGRSSTRWVLWLQVTHPLVQRRSYLNDVLNTNRNKPVDSIVFWQDMQAKVQLSNGTLQSTSQVFIVVWQKATYRHTATQWENSDVNGQKEGRECAGKCWLYPPQTCSFFLGDLDPRSLLRPHKSASQTASWLLPPFFHSWLPCGQD